MGYYTIQLSSPGQGMTMIVTYFGKLRYNCLLMVMYASGDIFKAKAGKLIGDIEGVKACIYGILVLIRESYSNNMENMKVIFAGLRDAGLKVNEPKCSYVLKEITYLGYVITRYGIKYNPRKVQGIMDLRRPITTT